MGRAKDIKVGDRFGLWTVIGEADAIMSPSGQHRRRVLARCACGTERPILVWSLTDGRSIACGCSRFHGRFHGHNGTPEHVVWKSMLARCRNQRNPEFKNYGGRGIVVCDRWHSFVDFLADMGRRPSLGHSIDRVDNDGNYEPGNCRWATARQQARNRRNSMVASINGETKLVAEWAEAVGVEPRLITNRLKKGWTPERAVFEPVIRRKGASK